MPKLLTQVSNQRRTRHYSYRTEQTYFHWIKQFIMFHHKQHPSVLGASDISAFLTHLAVQQNVSASTQNQALAAVLFLYRYVLEIDLPRVENVERANAPGKAGCGQGCSRSQVIHSSRHRRHPAARRAGPGRGRQRSHR